MKIGVHRHFCLCKMKDFSDTDRLSSILTKGLASLFNCSSGVALMGNVSCAVRRCLRACLYTIQWSFPGSAQWLKKKKSACNVGEVGLIPGLGRSPGGHATHSSIPSWEIAWTEMPGGLQSIGWQRVRYDWATEHACMCSMTHRDLHIFTNIFPQLPERWNGSDAEKSVANARTHPSGTRRIWTQHSSRDDSFPPLHSVLQWSGSH